MTDRSWPLRAPGPANPTGRDSVPARPAAWSMPAAPARIAADAGAAWPTRFWWVVGPASVSSGLVVIGVALGSGVIAMAGAGLALAAAVLAPEVGLAVLATLAPLQPPPSIPAPGLNFLLAGALVLGCVYRLPIDRLALRLNKAGLCLTGFVIYIAAQQLPDLLGGYHGDEGHAIGYLFFQVVTGFVTVLVACYVFRGRSPLPVLTMALVGAAIAATVAVATFESAAGPLGGLVAVADAGQRAAGPFVNPNYMGMFAAAAVVGIAAIWTAIRSRAARILLLAVAALCLVSIVEAQSRGAMVAGFAGIAVVAWLRNRALAVAIVGVGIVAAAVIYPAFVEWRLMNLQGDVSDAGYVQLLQSDDARLGASLAGPAMFLAEPIFGVGFGQFVQKSVEISGLQTGINAHNWYVNVLAEQGTTGGLLWFGAMIATVAAVLRRSGVARVVGVGMFAMIAVGSVFLEMPDSFQVAALPALFLVAGLVGDWRDRPAVATRTAELAESKGVED